MPFANPLKKKAYYERHKKHYDKKFKADNRNEWNKYQRAYKRKKRFDDAYKIKTNINKLNIADENSLTFKAAVILFYYLETGVVKQHKSHDVKTIFYNWSKSGIYKDGEIIIEKWETDLGFIVGITLISMTGSGDIKRIEANNPT